MGDSAIGPFEPWLTRWSLAPDGAPLTTHSSRLLPVVYRGSPAMLKVALIPEEARGARLLAWWAGVGAARVLELEGPAVLLPRATALRSLVEMSRSGRDGEATALIVAVAALLHRPIDAPPPDLVPLREWFGALFAAADSDGEALALAARTAERLIASTSGSIPLHGDLHHWNVLEFGRAWNAIDPKGLVGDRTFDLVHLLRNPDPATALAPGRLELRARQVAHEAVADRIRLLEWALAFAGLSAAWLIGDGESPEADLAMLGLAASMTGSG